jgi:hypothetical protein
MPLRSSPCGYRPGCTYDAAPSLDVSGLRDSRHTSIRRLLCAPESGVVQPHPRCLRPLCRSRTRPRSQRAHRPDGWRTRIPVGVAEWRGLLGGPRSPKSPGVLAAGEGKIRRADHRRGPRARGMGPGSRPWLLLPLGGDTAGCTPIQPDRLRYPCHRNMNIGRNSVSFGARSAMRPSTRGCLTRRASRAMPIGRVHRPRCAA